MQKCEKCGADMMWIYGPTTSLVGGVVATLCARCRTEWNKFASEHPVFQRLHELDCVLMSIMHAQELAYIPSDVVGNINLRHILEDIREGKAILHEEGLKWIGREEVNGNHSNDQPAN